MKWNKISDIKPPEGIEIVANADGRIAIAEYNNELWYVFNIFSLAEEYPEEYNCLDEDDREGYETQFDGWHICDDDAWLEIPKFNLENLGEWNLTVNPIIANRYNDTFLVVDKTGNYYIADYNYDSKWEVCNPLCESDGCLYIEKRFNYEDMAAYIILPEEKN